MFVTIIEVLDEAKQRRKQTIRSIVWLYPLNACPHCFAQRLNSSALVDEKRGTVCDWELENSIIGWRINPAFMNSYRVDKMIEGGAEIMKTVSSDQPPSISQGYFKVNGNVVASPLCVRILGESIRLRILPREDFITDGFGVFLCTPDLQPTVG
jgi:hypothetical protein